MRSIQPHAICAALASVSGPALVLDLGHALLLGADPAAARMWTGGAQIAALPLILDAAMPALAALRLAVGVEGTPLPWCLRLTFWTTAGAQSWNVQAQPIAGTAAGIVLVRLATEHPPAAQSLAGHLQSGRELRHLAHELRSPLAAIQSLADVLHGGHLGAIADARHRDYLASMRDTARHALDVIEAMLESPFSAQHKAAPAAGLDLNAAVAEVAAGMSALAVRSGVRLSVATAPGLPFVAADGTAVRQMLINLAANSLGHAGGGVTLTFATGVGEAHAGTAREIWAEVADNGPGFPASVIERLARGTPPDPPDASGRPQLGLSLTQSLAQANGGRLELTSGPAGACARLVFAAYQPPGGDQVAASSSG